MAFIGKAKGAVSKWVWTEEEEQWLIENFPYQLNKDLSKHLGLCETSIYYKAKSLGLTKDVEFMAKARKELAAKAAITCRYNGAYDKRKEQDCGRFLRKYHEEHGWAFTGEKERLRRERVSKGLKKAVAVDKARLHFGLEQRTGRRLDRQPQKRYQQRQTLRRLGYIIDYGSTTAYYTDQTQRSKIMEGRKMGDRHFIHWDFKPITEKV